MPLHQQEPFRRSSARHTNDAIEQEIKRSLRLAANNPKRINERLQELQGERALDETMQLNAAGFSLAGILLAATVNKRWLILPAAIGFFLAQQAIQGRSLPLSLLRKFGLKTRSEIDREKYALKMLRGDFGQRVIDADLAWEAVNKP